MSKDPVRPTARLNLRDSNNMSVSEALSVDGELPRTDPTVYNKLRFNVTRLDAVTRTEAFAQAQAGRMHVELVHLFAHIATETMAAVDDVADPRARKHTERFADQMLEQTAAGIGGTHLTALRAMDRIVAEPYLPPPPPQVSFLKWLFGG